MIGTCLKVRWGVDDEHGSQATAFRLLEDVIAGRARVVDDEGDLRVEHLGEGVPGAEVVRVLNDAKAKLQSIRETFHALGRHYDLGLYGNLAESLNPKSSTTGLLVHASQGIPIGMMNVALVKQVAQDVWDRSRVEGMVSIHKKVPRDHIVRLEAAAKASGMDVSDYLRAIIEINTPPMPKEA